MKESNCFRMNTFIFQLKYVVWVVFEQSNTIVFIQFCYSLLKNRYLSITARFLLNPKLNETRWNLWFPSYTPFILFSEFPLRDIANFLKNSPVPSKLYVSTSILHKTQHSNKFYTVCTTITFPAFSTWATHICVNITKP